MHPNCSIRRRAAQPISPQRSKQVTRKKFGMRLASSLVHAVWLKSRDIEALEQSVRRHPDRALTRNESGHGPERTLSDRVREKRRSLRIASFSCPGRGRWRSCEVRYSFNPLPGYGCVFTQWFAMSTRRVIHTPSCFCM